jgi:membrane protein implicated in regulation of membrane protease activity
VSFWELIFVLLIFIPLVMLWIFALSDLFRRADISGLAKALWAIAIVFFPLIGMVIYFIVRPADAKSHEEVREETQAEETSEAEKLEHLEKLAVLKDNGTITEEEFTRMKTQLLA